jgi:hypothetical protein
MSSPPGKKGGAGLDSNGARKTDSLGYSTARAGGRAQKCAGTKFQRLPTIEQITALIAAKRRETSAGKRKPLLSDVRVRRLHAIYRRGYSLLEIAEIFDLPWYPIWSGFHRLGLKVRPPHQVPRRDAERLVNAFAARAMSEAEIEVVREEFLRLPRGRAGFRGYSERFIQAMFADYLRNGEILAIIAKRWNRSAGAIKCIFQARKLRPPDPERAARVRERQRIDGSGCFARTKRATPAELKALIARIVADPKRDHIGSRRGKSKFSIPLELKWEFKTWAIEKRAWFIGEIRKRLNHPDDRPTTPFSSNVQPFDYATSAAREIQRKLNDGRDSRHAVCKIDTCSQGVIYKNELYFWSVNTGYVARGWNPIDGRPLLHWKIWEEHNGRKVPPGHVVRLVDGNHNNLAPENMILADRNAVCRETQMKTLMRRSREQTALLLRRSQRKLEEKDGLIETLKAA